MTYENLIKNKIQHAFVVCLIRYQLREN